MTCEICRAYLDDGTNLKQHQARNAACKLAREKRGLERRGWCDLARVTYRWRVWRAAFDATATPYEALSSKAKGAPVTESLFVPQWVADLIAEREKSSNPALGQMTRTDFLGAICAGAKTLGPIDVAALEDLLAVDANINLGPEVHEALASILQSIARGAFRALDDVGEQERLKVANFHLKEVLKTLRASAQKLNERIRMNAE